MASGNRAASVPTIRACKCVTVAMGSGNVPRCSPVMVSCLVSQVGGAAVGFRVAAFNGRRERHGVREGGYLEGAEQKKEVSSVTAA